MTDDQAPPNDSTTNGAPIPARSHDSAVAEAIGRLDEVLERMEEMMSALGKTDPMAEYWVAVIYESLLPVNAILMEISVGDPPTDDEA